MATVTVAATVQRRISLAQIDAIVSARLGPTRVPGNAQPACFNRQVAMYIAMYVDLLDAEGFGYSEWVESAFEPFGSGLLILDRIRIEPEHRGQGYGLYDAQLMITGFAPNGIVACVPAPYELLKDVPPLRIGEDDSNNSREKRIPGWTAAEVKLREYWPLLGFEQIPDSDVFALSLTTRRPPLESIIRKYLARNERQARSRK